MSDSMCSFIDNFYETQKKYLKIYVNINIDSNGRIKGNKTKKKLNFKKRTATASCAWSRASSGRKIVIIFEI